MENIPRWLFHILEMPMGHLQNLLRNIHPKIKFTMEHSFKELPFLEILIKTKMAKFSQKFTTNPLTPNNTFISKVINPKKLHNIHRLHQNTYNMHQSLTKNSDKLA